MNCEQPVKMEESPAVEERKEEQLSFKTPALPSMPTKVSIQMKESGVSDLLELSYSAPSWSSKPSPENAFFIEVIKNGVVVEQIQLHSLKNESFLCIGRFPPSDIQLDHPSVSRHHCILQYGNLVEQAGWYLFDMGSTHGTKLNKKPAKKHCYIHLRPGYVFQIAGCSSRVFSFCGKGGIGANEPAESSETKQQQGPAAKEVEESKSENGEDGANKAEQKYFEKDPIGWLDKYFEREGLPMNYQYTRPAEPGGDWLRLGNLISASAFTRQLAQFQCSLVACERLEANGLLRTFSILNKRKTYAENDYYDSDEDTFFDRTGQIEEQRRKRKMRCEGDETAGKSKSYDELKKTLIETESKLTIVKSEIQRLLGKNAYTDAEGNILKTANFSMRMTISQMKSKEKKLVEECAKLSKLVEFVKPHGLDEMFPMKKLEVSHPFRISRSAVQQKSDEIPGPSTEQIGGQKSEPDVSSKETKKDSAGVSAERVKSDTREDDEKPSVAIEPPIKRERNYQPAMPEFIQPKFGILTKEEARIRHPVRVNRRQHSLEEELVGSDYSTVPVESQGEYATWLPPENQSGDGITKLNAKFKGRY
uniref:FHA domain-containing protein n=1 Tax=Ditylenchus dipsaci TaxID=166011 RepID=A0A915DHG1_9BILA